MCFAPFFLVQSLVRICGGGDVTFRSNMMGIYITVLIWIGANTISDDGIGGLLMQPLDGSKPSRYSVCVSPSLPEEGGKEGGRTGIRTAAITPS